MNLNEAEQLQRLINEFSLVERRHYIPNTEIKENDAAHTVSVTMLSWYLCAKLQLPDTLNLEKILRYATVHDLVEAYAGDVPTHANKLARKQKKIDEDRAMQRIQLEFSNSFPSMVADLHAYENKVDEEALFVWIVDKMQSYIQGFIDDWRPYHEHPVTINMFSDTLSSQRAKCPEELLPFFDDMTQKYIPDYIKRYTEAQI